MTSEVKVGRMYSFPSLTKELVEESVVISNSPFLKSKGDQSDDKMARCRIGEGNIPEPPKVNVARPYIQVQCFKLVFHNLAKVSESGHIPPAEIASHCTRNDTERGSGISNPISNSHLGVVR